MTGKLLVMAAGGTGGHMFPAQALAEEMLSRGWRVRLSTDARGARYTGNFPKAVEISQVTSATFARGGPLAKLAVPFRVLGGVTQARAQMAADKPSVVVGFGGYPSIPALGAAWTLGIPRMIHEQNGVLGRVNKVFAPRVQVLACGTWPTELPGGVEGRHVGNPVRSTVLEVAQTPYAEPGNGPLKVLIIGGSQGARILSDQVPAALAALPEDLRAGLEVTHQARPEDLDRVKQAYAQAGITATCESFFTDVPERLAEAHVMISRAGASTVAEIGVIGRPSILIPFAAATGDHQTANAKGLVDAGAAVAIQESDLDAARLAREVSEILTAPQKAAQMAQAAKAQAKPKAAAELADIAEDLAKTAP